MSELLPKTPDRLREALVILGKVLVDLKLPFLSVTINMDNTSTLANLEYEEVNGVRIKKQVNVVVNDPVTFEEGRKY